MVQLNDLLDLLDDTTEIRIYGDDLEECIYEGAHICNDMDDIREKNYTVQELSANDMGEIIILV